MDNNRSDGATGDEHYDGGAFSYVVVAFLLCVLVPWSISLFREWQASRQQKKDEIACNCEGCAQKTTAEEQKNKHLDRKTFAKYAVFVFLWIVLLVALASAVLQESEADGTFDPFKVLELTSDATDKQIRKAYKLLTVKWHPDKNPDQPELAERMFIEVAKAYKTLTDEVAKKNWQEYGNPDGPQGFDVGIALPAWLVDQGNSIVVLLLYVVVFMVALPALVVRLWFQWRELAPNEVKYQTMSIYTHFLQVGMKIEHMIEVLAASSEFDDMPIRKSDQTPLAEIVRGLEKKDKSMKPPKDGTYREEFRSAGYVIKNNLLIYAHINRLHKDLDPALRGDLDSLLQKAPHLVNGMLSIIQGRNRGPSPLPLVLLATKLSQVMVQACWPNQELLQLPHIDNIWARELASKKYNNAKGLIRNFANLSKDARQKVFLGDEKLRNNKNHIFMTSDQLRDIESVLSRMPLHLAVDVEVRVEDEVSFISTDAIVSVFVRCNRVASASESNARTRVTIADADNVQALIAAGAKLKGSAARVAQEAVAKQIKKKKGKSNTSNASTASTGTAHNDNDKTDTDSTETATADDDEDDDDTWHAVTDQSEKKVAAIRSEGHCPFVPQRHAEAHWVLLADTNRQLLWSVKKTNINPIGADNETLKLMFQAPDRPGKHSYSLFVISDSYLGCDTKVDFTIQVHEAPEFQPVVDEIYSDEEVSLSDDDEDPDDDFEDK